MQGHDQKGCLSWGSLVLQRKNRQELKHAQVGDDLSEFTSKGESQNGSPRWHWVCQAMLGCCKATAVAGWGYDRDPEYWNAASSRPPSLMSSLLGPSSSAKRWFSMSKGHKWDLSCDTSPSPQAPLQAISGHLVPLAQWCLHLPAGLAAGSPTGSAACRQQSNHAAAQVHHGKPKVHSLSCRRGHCGTPGQEPPENMQGLLFQQQKKGKLFHWYTTMLYFFPVIIGLKNALACWG